MSEITFDVSIPCDDDGFVLLRCPKCGEYFKLPPNEIEKEELLEIHCPLCGLVNDSYFTEDVIELAEKKAMNYAMDTLFQEFKNLERKHKNSLFKIEVDKPEKEDEIPIRVSTDSMEIVYYSCCGKQAKIRHLLHFSGGYCPYCGGIQYDNN